MKELVVGSRTQQKQVKMAKNKSITQIINTRAHTRTHAERASQVRQALFLLLNMRLVKAYGDHTGQVLFAVPILQKREGKSREVEEQSPG